jgi:hypothetical protein
MKKLVMHGRVSDLIENRCNLADDGGKLGVIDLNSPEAISRGAAAFFCRYKPEEIGKHFGGRKIEREGNTVFIHALKKNKAGKSVKETAVA